MKKHYLILFMIAVYFNIMNAQVGVNTSRPKGTLHVQKKPDITFPDGIIPPRISGDSLAMKNNAYGQDQNGIIVYVTSPVTTSSVKTQNILSQGLYVYDANFNNGRVMVYGIKFLSKIIWG